MTPRSFSVEVVEKLQNAGFDAFWAGGCVRDQILGIEPQDYDVATNATPDQIRETFGKNKTLAIGAAFGVITVLGPKPAGQVEVATFRKDGGYSDGRRPDNIEFTDAKEDALRRDFTINGMFLDPTTGKLIDYVNGQEDLGKRLIRAIGVPEDRIQEDKLRMLRAVRFAATFEFAIEPETMRAIQDAATELTVVSGERIGTEMRRMLTHPNRATAVSLLRETKLLEKVIPNADTLFSNKENWDTLLSQLRRLEGGFESALAILMEPIFTDSAFDSVSDGWKLSNYEIKTVRWIHQNWKTLVDAEQQPWSVIQPLLIQKQAPSGLAMAACQTETPPSGVDFCRDRLAWKPDKLDPPPLLDGGALIKLGITPSPKFSLILSDVRTAQLDGEISTTEQAVERARQMVG
ncbi:MAG: CCA tRNA nucleotidyltransferase [Mariniblastus sp.]